MRPATSQDQAAIEQFLLDHLGTSMFPLGNLRRFGPCGGDHPRAMRFWIAGDMAGVVGLSTQGILMPQWPDADWSEVIAALSGATISGLIGDGAQVGAARRAFGLAAAPTNLDAQEKLFEMPLQDFRFPVQAAFSLAPLTDWTATALDWRKAYHAEVLGTPADDIDATARSDIQNYIDVDSHRMLLRDGHPVSMTGFNMVLPEAVQVGGVYTPPELRGRHHARTALGLHLAAVAPHHPLAILFALSDPAIRAYRAIGFRETGSFALVLFTGKERIQ